MDEEIRKLATDVDRRWHEVGFDLGKFPAVAAGALRAAKLHEKLDPLDPARWVIRALDMPAQRDLSFAFGEPPITVFQNDHFEIDIYYWLDSTTAIHEHSFCGAFGVMSGGSLHSLYRFEERERISDGLRIGEIKVDSCELLGVGDVHEIHAGTELIHSLYHLDRPSVSVVVRTAAPWALPQKRYLWPGIAVNTFKNPHQIRRYQCLEMMAKVDEAAFLEELKRTLKGVSPVEFANLVLGLRSRLGRTPDLVEKLGEVGKEHALLVEELILAIKHEKRTIKLTEIRRRTADPEERFLLALLLNLRSSEDFIAIAGKHWQGEVLEDSLKEVLERFLQRHAEPPFGLPDEPELASICARLLAGKPLSEFPEEWRDAAKAVAKNSIFRPYANPGS